MTQVWGQQKDENIKEAEECAGLELMNLKQQVLLHFTVASMKVGGINLISLCISSIYHK